MHARNTCNAKLERFKTKPPSCGKNEDAGAIRLTQLNKSFFIEKTFTNHKIYKVVQERDDPNMLDDVLEQAFEKENLLMEVFFAPCGS